MSKALAIIKRDGDTTRGVTFDRETLEFKMLNDKTQQRKDAQAASEAAAYRERQRKRDYEWFCTMSFGYLVIRALILVLTGILTADGILPFWLSDFVSGWCIGTSIVRVVIWIKKARHHK